MLIFMTVAAIAAFILSRHIDTTVEYDLVAFRNGGRILSEWTSASVRGSHPPVAGSNHEVLNLLGDRSDLVLSPEVALGITGNAHTLWFFPGTQGILTAALARPAIVKTVRLKHHPEQRTCMASDIVVWGLITDPKRLDLPSLSWSPLPKELRDVPPPVPSLRDSSVETFWVPLAHIENWKPATSGHTDLDSPHQVVAKRVSVYALALELKSKKGCKDTSFSGFNAFGVTQG